MGIQFHCEHCRKEIKAPDAAGGRRGKCPYCGGSCYIPSPVAEDELLPLAPLDESDERRRQQEVQHLINQERAILAEIGGHPQAPPEPHELKPDDLHHLVVNYCLDMGNGHLTRARKHVEDLRKHGTMGSEALTDFLTGKVKEPALANLPPRVLQGFLTQLRADLRGPE